MGISTGAMIAMSVMGAVSAGTAAYQIKSGIDQKNDAEKAAADQAQKESDLQKQMKDEEQAKESAQANQQAMNQARAVQRDRVASYMGYGNSIGGANPNPATGSATSAGGQKTLLGQ